MNILGVGKLAARVDEALIKHDLKPYLQILKEIKKLDYQALSNAQVTARSLELIAKAQTGADLDDLLIVAYALVNEAACRVLKIRPFETQLLAGMALHFGKLAELPTGEGKTLVAVFPAYLNALQGKGVHVYTFNDYLAVRDAHWMGPVYSLLGLKTAFIKEGMGIRERQTAYAADITYVTPKEAGFDYLRDCLCYDKAELVHRQFNYAVIDEADSILIDEARVPLVIAGATSAAADSFEKIMTVIKRLENGIDYSTDKYQRNAFLTDAGVDKVEELLNCSNLFDPVNIDTLTAINCALHAEMLLKRDVDYIVRDGRVLLVDESTGRIAENRQWPDGLQNAVAAKEGLGPQANGRVLGTITLQNFLKLYPRLCGMTATAKTSAEEFRATYSLEVITIPPNRPCIRRDLPDLVFTHQAAKYRALVEEVVRVHATGRPILIGTASVEESELLAAALKSLGISCIVLNAKNNEQEAEIITRAGEYGSVTVSTNMAGRGVDIRLGDGSPGEWARVAQLGGLYVIGTNRHESIRIDNQLRGRAGRQGDPGSSRFFISLEDDLTKRFGIEKVIHERYRFLKQDEPLKDPRVNKDIAHIQRVVNGQNHDMRKTLNKYSYILEQQRRIIRQKRREVLMEKVPLTLIAEKEPELYYKVCAAYGEEAVTAAEKYATLLVLDQCWANFLDYAAYVREGIHLVSIGRKNPVDEFHKLVIQAFDNMLGTIEEEIIKTFKTADLTSKGFNLEHLEQAGLKKPSATWTYMVTDDYFLDKKA